ncbi:MAG: hypothetical protein RBT34_14100 [Anaerolineaceae bacterium]|jgi:hypothetical protein|nr:hypothetical protein [Anaerolineaceae bacterium]
MSWFTSRETIGAETLSEVLEGVLYVRPNLHLQFDAPSPFAQRKNLTIRLNNEIIKLERVIHDLTIELKDAEQPAAEH